MWLLFLEAGLALGLLVFIVWWTMFSDKNDDARDSGPRISVVSEAATK
jgi:hypothetical protein